MKPAGKPSKRQGSGRRPKDAPKPKPFPIVGIGASAGGLEAFTKLLECLPTDAGLACVLVQHLDPVHASHLVELLGRVSAFPVHEVENGIRVEANHVYVIPPNTQLRIESGRLWLTARTDVGHHMPIDAFFASLAADVGNQAIGVVLSGMGGDGTIGLKAIKAGGGIVIAQDHTAAHDGMPTSAIASGCVDLALPPDAIARELVRLAKLPYVNGGLTVTGDTPAPPALLEGLQPVFRLLRQTTRVDYANYKISTIQRRLQRRMIVKKIDHLEDYIALLTDNPQEVQALHEELLINVTSFFRDPDSYQSVQFGSVLSLVEK